MILLEHVSKLYNESGEFAVNDVNLSISQGELLVLLGSSGSGKTTLLKMINRLIMPSSGDIYINDTNTKAIPLIQLRRSIGYVFQQIGLFPHLTVHQNIEVVLKLNHYPKPHQHRIDEVLNLVQLDSSYANRYPDELSGGQQQRVGVARALSTNPDILLMDEPFGALDPITRDALQQELLDLKKKLNKTIIFVTHDMNEAARLADHIAMLYHGKLLQTGTYEQLVQNPNHDITEQMLQIKTEAI